MNCQLISYIAPSAPATRRTAEGTEPFLRPEIGFTPKWFHETLGIDFGESWHTDPAYRRETVIVMREELRHRFPGTSIGGIDRPESPLDFLTGVFGACVVPAVYGVPIIYSEDNWPVSARQYLSDEQVDHLTPPDLERCAFYCDLMKQVDWIAEREGRVIGFINWQSVLNTAHRLRGEKLFIDLMEHPQRVRHLFNCICTTMVDAVQRLYTRQRQTGFEVPFFTVSNCLVNMISPQQYTDLILPIDQLLADKFGCIGIHNCAWSANPYLDAYAKVPNVSYIDMGIDSDLSQARDLFPHARRSIMYTPMDLVNKSIDRIECDLIRIADNYGPCDFVAADIEDGTPDVRVLKLIELCSRISKEYTNGYRFF